MKYDVDLLRRDEIRWIERVIFSPLPSDEDLVLCKCLTRQLTFLLVVHRFSLAYLLTTRRRVTTTDSLHE